MASKDKGLDLERKIEPIKRAEIRTEAHVGWSKGWMARIELAAPGARFDLTRSFLSPDRTSLSRRGNGQKIYELAGLADGVYEADSVWRSSQAQRVYFEVKNEAVKRCSEAKGDAKKWLRAMKTKPAKTKPSKAKAKKKPMPPAFESGYTVTMCASRVRSTHTTVKSARQYAKSKKGTQIRSRTTGKFVKK